jgi:hypothetical protein
MWVLYLIPSSIQFFIKKCKEDDTFFHVDDLPQLNLKFMRSYHFQKLPLSYAQLWQTNAERNPERVLRNANDFFTSQHRIEP